jgi:aminomethyltransferase
MPGDLISFTLEGYAITALRLAEPFGLEWRLLASAAARPTLIAALGRGGALPLSHNAYEMVRIERGVPAPGAELTEAYTPLEVGFSAAVSTTKGCYTGQEVIARQLVQDKVTHQMVGLRTSRLATVGEKVLHRGKSVGEITSATETPALGPIALAMVRKPYHEPGTAVRLGQDDDTAITAVVTPIPFNFAI